MAFVPGIPNVQKSSSLASIAAFAGGLINIWRTTGKPSLTAFTKGANVMSRLYIEDSILRDDICVPLVGTLNQLYVSYILAALNLDTMCANGRTVREQFELVATENYDIIDEILTNFGKNSVEYSNEETVVQLEPNTQRLPVGRVIELTMTGYTVLPATTKKTDKEVFDDAFDVEKTYHPTIETTENGERRTSGGTSTSEMRYDKNGNLINVKNTWQKDNVTQASTDKKTTNRGKEITSTDRKRSRTSETETEEHGTTFQFKAYLYVQLIPYVLTPDVVSGYIGANFAPPVSRRWTKFKAGEISFWKDFILARDIIRKQKKILKQDKHGIILSMMQKQRSSLYAWWEGLLGLMTQDRNGHNPYGVRGMSHNLANTMLITSKATFDRTCRELGLNFDNWTQRQKFFNKTWSMLICVVDPLYNTVEMYFNGVDMKGSYNFAMINKVGAKGQDNFDLKEVMSAFSQGLTPKF